MTVKRNILLPVLALSCLGLSACAPALVGGGVVAGMAATQEGGISGAVDDAKIRIQINDLWFRSNVEMFRKLDLTVNQGRVLITGVVQNPEDRVEAVRLAWQAGGVRQVINEIKVADSEGVTGYIRDTWITARLRTALTLDDMVQNLNYSIDTVQGTVYLMGVASSQAELNRVLELARTIPNVTRVVSYIKLHGEAVGAPSPGYGDAPPQPLNGGESPAMTPAPDYAPDSAPGYAPAPSYNGAVGGSASVGSVEREPL